MYFWHCKYTYKVEQQSSFIWYAFVILQRVSSISCLFNYIVAQILFYCFLDLW